MDPLPELARREVECNPVALGPDAGAVIGLACAACGCQDMRVGCTKDITGGVRRYRYCRNCKRGMPTEEIAASELANLRRLAGM